MFFCVNWGRKINTVRFLYTMEKRLLNLLVFWFFVYFRCASTAEYLDQIDSYSNRQLRLRDEVENIQRSNGSSVTLKCDFSLHKVTWEFMACSKKMFCESSWRLMNVAKKKRQHDLHLVNVTNNHTGFYRCFVKEKIFKFYKLEVTNLQEYAKIREGRGRNLTLKCPTQEQYVSWEFKACSRDEIDICKNKNVPWKAIENHFYKRSDVLELKNIISDQSGLYRCLFNKKIIKTYQVEVTYPKYQGPPPKILEISPYISKGATLVRMRCIVFSELPPNIFYLKESDESAYDIMYLRKFYQTINITAEVYSIPFKRNIYANKLTLYNVTESGNYVCLAITQFGKDYRVCNVKVVQNLIEPRTSFSLFFLIPLPFIVVPAIVWLCYYKKKTNKDKKLFPIHI